jgi:hypothetical protein
LEEVGRPSSRNEVPGPPKLGAWKFGAMLNPKLETLNSKQTQMSKTQNLIPYDWKLVIKKLKLPLEFVILDLFRI